MIKIEEKKTSTRRGNFFFRYPLTCVSRGCSGRENNNLVPQSLRLTARTARAYKTPAGAYARRMDVYMCTRLDKLTPIINNWQTISAGFRFFLDAAAAVASLLKLIPLRARAPVIYTPRSYEYISRGGMNCVENVGFRTVWVMDFVNFSWID